MASKKAICSNGKSFLINPNLLFGQGFDDNISVPLEDLNIYVELTTSKKNRSIIDATPDNVEYTSSDVGKKKVSFIDGSPNGKFTFDKDGKKIDGKSLTTSYTELTTVFNKTADTEKFGISSINIDFNSAYAPLVNIEFIDIRGASLFNTGNPPNSEYSGFFDLPYPIFQLKVKGYYGKTVKYCLHLTKWNARFNTTSGNFEITADFIGYTYAMLTDMLLGYLRAITYTPRGASMFQEAQAEMNDEHKDELITIKDLLDRFVDVNEAINKLQDGDSNIKELSQNREVSSALDGIKNVLKEGIDNILEADSSSKDGYALLNSGDGLIGVRYYKDNEDEAKIDKEYLSTWRDAMKTQVTELNANISSTSPFNIDDFAGDDAPKTYYNFNYNRFISGTTETNKEQRDFKKAWSLNDSDFRVLMEERMKNLTSRTSNMRIYDFSKTIKKIDEIDSNIISDEETIKKNVAIKIKETFKKTLGFEPTIGAIFRIFTVHAEIFLACLKEVSKKAEEDVDKLRFKELTNLSNNLDIHKSLPNNIYPWPLFRAPSREENKKGNLEEAYLGDKLRGGVNTPQNVPELVFVEELLEALIQVAIDDAARQERIDNPNVIIDSWFPINVLDTPLFGVKQNPYKTDSIGNSNNPLDPLKLMMMRAFVFLGVSNRAMDTSEIELMGTLEANTCFEGISKGDSGKILKLAMISGGDSSNETIADNIISYFKKGTNGTRNVSIKFGENKALSPNPRPLFSEVDGKYAYTYISNEPSDDDTIRRTAISFNDDFDGSGFFKNTGPATASINLTDKELLPKSWWKNPDGGLLFIEPNYGPIITSRDVLFEKGPFKIVTNKTRKFETGAIFMKIFTEDEYKDEKELRPTYTEQEDSIQKMFETVQSIPGNTPYLDSGSLYGLNRDSEKNPFGFNIFGDETSKFAFTTLKIVDISNLENSKADSEEKGIPTQTLDGVPLKCMFYINQASKYGATSLSQPLSVGVVELDQKPHKGKTPENSNVEYFDTRFHSTGARQFYKNSVVHYPDLGKNRELFIDENAYIPHVDFIVTNRDTKDYNPIDNEYSVYSLFGSEWYFEQRRSSSPKAARAFLFLHTFPWNQLYTDNVNGLSSDGHNASIFDNAEGATISNLFDRKSAFINAPYLWCAFIGGILWRYNDNPIIWEIEGPESSAPDHSGKVPSYRGGSGDWDPIVFGKTIKDGDKYFIDRESCYLSDYRIAYQEVDDKIPYDKFPLYDQYMTSFDAGGPLELDTDGKYKSIEDVLLSLPVQTKKEFRRIFFDFVNSTEWKDIRAAYELHPNGFNNEAGENWDLPNAGSDIEYNTDGDINNKYYDKFSDGSSKWLSRWGLVGDLYEDGFPPIRKDGLETEVSSISVKEGQKTGGRGGTKSENVIHSGGIIGIKADIVKSFPNWKNYEYLQPIRKFAVGNAYGINNADVVIRYNWDMSFKNNDANKTLVELFRRGVWIANASFKPWVQAPKQEVDRDNIVVAPNNLKLYVLSFVNEWKRLLKLKNEKNEEDAIKQQLFNTMDNNTIRFNIYRHCKAIYDKWIAGSAGDVMVSCGQETKSIDKASANFKRKTNKPRLIDSFRFVNRGFNDLSDTYLLNPAAINDIMTNNLNQSFYDLISRILSDNNFNFIALPAYIDFGSEEDMEALFKPEIFTQPLSDNVSGPTFVCVYIGQSSNKLDLGTKANFPNDGFDFKCTTDAEGKGQLVSNGDGSVPADLVGTKKPYEHNVIAFAVNYGQQNQNIFTDIKLDQQEFSETDESLQITDAIANNGSQSNRTQAGQNLWNVYQVRSYSAQVEAMGNAMIQPMMYFQLNNIPMFHGAYMIINTKHQIKPNYMTTSFKGVRVRYTDTPQVDSESLYMSMLGTLSDVDSASSYTIGGASPSGAISGSFQPIVLTLIENGVSNGYIELGGKYEYITTKKVDVGGISFGGKDDSYMITEASNALTKMLKEWTKWMGDNGFKKDGNGKYGYIGSLYRSYNTQAGLASGQKTAAKAGASYHGWGLAVDMSWVNKEGKIIQFNYKVGSSPKDFDYTYNPAIEWLYNNSYRFGFINPSWARDNSGYDEAWHWEYHGTSAKCLLNKNPNVYGKKIDTTKEYDIIVKNPKTAKGIEAVYDATSCDKKYIEIKGDGLEQKDTNLTDPERLENQIKTKNFFKSKGYTKQQTAGIMGNIQQESKFNPLATNKADLNGYPSVGLIQWNGKYLPKGGSNDANGVFNVIGKTVTEQLNYLVGMSTFEKFAKLNDTKNDVAVASYQFANIVEICDKCNQGLEIYTNSYQNVRTEYANDFLRRFNDDKDLLAWDGTITTINDGFEGAAAAGVSASGGGYTKKTSGTSIYTIPKKNDDSFNIVVVYGGIDYANPSWMLQEVEASAKSLLGSNIFLFVPHTYTWAQTEEKIDIIKSTNTLNKYSIIGFSAGGLDVQLNITKKDWKFIGLIDPSTNATTINNTNFNYKTYMIYNTAHWASCCPNIITDQPNLSNKIVDSGGESEFINISHNKMPKEFFSKYSDKINSSIGWL